MSGLEIMTQRLGRQREWIIFFTQWEKLKKDNHSHNYHDRQKHFPQYLLLVDGIMGKEDQFLLATLSQLMAAKIDEFILYFAGWVNERIKITVARLYYRVLHGVWVTTSVQT